MTAKERPILFKGPMVRAILEGRKMQTRRLINKKWLPIVEECLRVNGKWVFDTFDFELTTPFGKPSDRLWVKENWIPDFPRTGDWPDVSFFGCGAKDFSIVPDHYKKPEHCIYQATWNGSDLDGWTPSIHMFRWASRITLEITDIRVERLQAMTENDALCEGAELACAHCGEPFCIEKCAMGACWKPECGAEDFSFIAGFKILWDSLAKPGFLWADNPWVWVIEFRKVTE